MAAHSGDTHILARIKGRDATPAGPYASRSAGLYSEVSWDSAARPPARTQRPKDKDDGSRPVPTL